MTKLWRAYKSLEWFIFTGFAMAGFVALIAVATLLATARPLVRWQVPLVAQSQTLQFTEADFMCTKTADCRVVYSDCSHCGEGTAVNISATSRTASMREQLCLRWRGRICLLEAQQTFCIASRCTLTPPTTTDTTDWQTYHNEGPGYSLRYPADWTSVIYNDTNTLFGPTGEIYADRNGESKYAVLLDAAVMDNPQTIESIAQRGRDEGKTVHFMTVAGLPAVQLADHTYVHTYVISGDVLYMLVYKKAGGDDSDQTIYDAMVQSLQITTSQDTIGWKTYRNEQYEFTFSYPPDLIVTDINQYRNGAYDLLVSQHLGEELTFCEAEPNSPRCERIDVDGAVGIITWPSDEYDGAASVEIDHAKPVYLELNLGPGKTPDLFRQILATLQFIP